MAGSVSKSFAAVLLVGILAHSAMAHDDSADTLGAFCAELTEDQLQDFFEAVSECGDECTTDCAKNALGTLAHSTDKIEDCSMYGDDRVNIGTDCFAAVLPQALRIVGEMGLSVVASKEMIGGCDFTKIEMDDILEVFCA